MNKLENRVLLLTILSFSIFQSCSFMVNSSEEEYDDGLIELEFERNNLGGVFEKADSGKVFNLWNTEEWYMLNPEPVVTLSKIDQIFARNAEMSWPPEIKINFNEVGAKEIAAVTKRHQGEKIFFVFNSILISAPLVQEEITGGKTSISGGWFEEDFAEIIRIIENKE